MILLIIHESTATSVWLIIRYHNIVHYILWTFQGITVIYLSFSNTGSHNEMHVVVPLCHTHIEHSDRWGINEWRSVTNADASTQLHCMVQLPSCSVACIKSVDSDCGSRWREEKIYYLLLVLICVFSHLVRPCSHKIKNTTH